MDNTQLPSNNNIEQIQVLQSIAAALLAANNPTTLNNTYYSAAGVNSQPGKLKIQVGWGSVRGNGTTTGSQTVTFPTAFSSPPIVLMSCVGLSSAAATDPGGGTLGIFGGVVNPVGAVSASFAATWFQSAALSTSFWVVYTWIAIGT
jgi:hypothetical protein